MKITKIEITDFHQFKDLTIDLTYPKGHEKAGKPLDKVCFIGQSGTGKTTLLELIPILTHQYGTKILTKDSRERFLNNVRLRINFGESVVHEATLHLSRNPDTKVYRFWVDAISNSKKVEADSEFRAKFQNWIQQQASKPIYFPANLNFDIDNVEYDSFTDKKIVDFSKDKVASVWHLILEQIQPYQEQELQIRQEISRTAEQFTNNSELIIKAVKKLEDWKKTEFNPIQDIADNCLNRLLTPFNLRVKTELDIQSKEDIGFIKLEDYNGNEIPNGLWSTGTKQIILSALPLYLLKPKHTVILFDEPERSLYPDRQSFIIDYYTSLTEDCQFFYSTHSPIIASEFEPWEIVELKFNKEGKVYRELYYPEEEENHIDNYIVDPRFLNYDLILSKVFDVQSDNTDMRIQAITEFTMLKNQLEKLKAENKLKSKQGKETFKRYQNLGKKLAWNKELANA